MKRNFLSARELGAKETIDRGVRVAERYRLVKLLGEGGMGQVFEAEHEALGRRFALKVLRIEPFTDEILKRFQREARALGRVAGVRVAQVTDFGVDDEVGPFYVMELLDGETLEQRIKRVKRLAIPDLVPIAIDLCESLAEVHAASIVHRDLKPSNIGLPRSGPVKVKLLDFGLAAIVEDTFAERLTQSQQFIGTLPYMAPEQFAGAPPAPKLDLYALGVVLYEMVSGRLPFKAQFPAALVQQHLFEPPPPFAESAPGVEVPSWLAAIVMRLLAKDPDDRYADPSTVARAIAERDPGEARDTEPHTRRKELPPGLRSHELAAAARSLLVGAPANDAEAEFAGRAATLPASGPNAMVLRTPPPSMPAPLLGGGATLPSPPPSHMPTPTPSALPMPATLPTPPPVATTSSPDLQSSTDVVIRVPNKRGQSTLSLVARRGVPAALIVIVAGLVIGLALIGAAHLRSGTPTVAATQNEPAAVSAKAQPTAIAPSVIPVPQVVPTPVPSAVPRPPSSPVKLARPLPAKATPHAKPSETPAKKDAAKGPSGWNGEVIDEP